MNRRLFIAGSFAGIADALATPGSSARYVELEHPVRWAPPEKTPRVIEIFWYGCQHCYSFELALRSSQSALARWQHEMVRMPAMFDMARPHAAVFFTAQELGVLDKFHWPFFRAIHERGNSMSSDSDVAEFFATLGIDRPTFERTRSSSAVATKLEAARDLSRQVKVAFVPWLVVDGRFACSPASAGGNEALLQLVDELL